MSSLPQAAEQSLLYADFLALLTGQYMDIRWGPSYTTGTRVLAQTRNGVWKAFLITDLFLPVDQGALKTSLWAQDSISTLPAALTGTSGSLNTNMVGGVTVVQGAAAPASGAWPVFLARSSAELVGQKTMALSIPVVIASDQSLLTFNVQNKVQGSAIPFTNLKTPDVFKPQNGVAIGAEATIWTPAAGKKFRLMGYHLSASVAGNISLKDNTGGTEIFVVPSGAGGSGVMVLLGNGKLSAAANNVLTATGPAASTLSGVVFGTEE